MHRAYLEKRFPWWCRQCPNPWSCATCKEKKRERLMDSIRNRRPRTDASGYFRPQDAERWWQHKSHALVQNAIKRGLLPSLKAGNYACVDCGDRALEYDHRDYGRPFDVDPVCRSCNKRRGTAKWPTAERFAFKVLPQDSNVT